jgi:polysaccharide biosynthesis transport protein
MTEPKSDKAGLDSNNELLDSSINWKAYLVAIRERLWLIVFCICAGAGIAYYQTEKTVPIYAARCTVSAERPDRVLTGIESVKTDLMDNSWAASIVETMNSPELVNRVNSRLGKESKSHAALSKNVETSSDATSPWFIISKRADSSMIDIVAEHTDFLLASLWANGMVDEYQMFRNEAISKATATANKFLMDEAARIREKLTVSEVALQEYREKKGAVSLEKDQDVVISRFRELSNQFNLARDKRLSLEVDMTKAEKLGENVTELAKLQSVVNSPGVVAASLALEEAEKQMVVLSQRYLHKHPKYKSLQAEVDGLQIRKNEAIVNAAKSLKGFYTDATTQENRLRLELDDQEKKTYVLGKLQVDYDKLKREIEADKVIYDQVLARLKETDLTKGLEELQNSPLRILQSATPNDVPVRPDKKKILLSGVFGGLGLGILIVIGLHLADGSFHTVDEVEQTLNLPVLAAVSMRKAIPSHWNKLPYLDTVHTKHGPISEAFRALRTALILLGRDEDRKIVMVTSALPGEGKSFTAANLAVTFAQQDLNTLLIDFDLRKPVVGKRFFETPPEKGATDVLANQIHFSDAVVVTSVPCLSILSSGSKAPNPSELFSGTAVVKLLDDLRNKYDRIVIDTPPIIPVSDPLLIAPLVDTVLQVVHSNKTPKIAVQRANQAITRALKKEISGIVLNQLPLKSRGYYYYYNYSGKYGDEGVYGAPT